MAGEYNEFKTVGEEREAAHPRSAFAGWCWLALGAFLTGAILGGALYVYLFMRGPAYRSSPGVIAPMGFFIPQSAPEFYERVMISALVGGLVGSVFATVYYLRGVRELRAQREEIAWREKMRRERP